MTGQYVNCQNLPGIFLSISSKDLTWTALKNCLTLCWSETISICGSFLTGLVFFKRYFISLNLSRLIFHLLLGSGMPDREQRGWNRCSGVEFPPHSYGNRQDLLCLVYFVQHKLAFLKDSQEFGSQNIQWNIMDDENNGSTLSKGISFYSCRSCKNINMVWNI